MTRKEGNISPMESIEKPGEPSSGMNGGWSDDDRDGYRRPGRGLLVAVGVFLVICVPAAGSAYLAVISLSGCLIECSDPAPVRGAWWTLVTLVLLAAPVVVGLIVARVPLRRSGPWLLGLVVAASLGFFLLRRVA